MITDTNIAHPLSFVNTFLKIFSDFFERRLTAKKSGRMATDETNIPAVGEGLAPPARIH
ncbi:MAG: hypothetical protein J6D21_04210 [Clostridia bacterium]|nr:hypothetical protein [Clostridia bacterium]